MQSKVTVIVPIYNVEKYVGKCLTSLVNQTFKDIEIWAVSDGSPDNSDKIVRSYQRKFKNIKFIEKENGGYGSVLEYCINNIKTKYFIICDPDDWLTNDCIDTLYKIAQKDNLDIVVGDKYKFYGNTKRKYYQSSIPRNLGIRPNCVYTSIKKIQTFSLGEVTPHSKLYKTEIVKGIKLPRKVSYTDFVLYMIALSNSKRVEYTNKALAYYFFDREGNTATSVRSTIINDYLVGWDAIYKYIYKKKDYVLLFRLLLQIQMILNEYARISVNVKNNSKNFNNIYRRLCLLFPLKKNIINNLPNKISFLHRILYKNLLTPLTSKLFLRLLLINDERKFKVGIKK